MALARGGRGSSSRAAAVALAAVVLAGVASGDFAADRAECSDKLVGLATCLTYVQDEVAAPTPDESDRVL